MSQSYVYLSVDMTEISKAEYYEARKDKVTLVVDKPYGFVWSKGATRIVYLTQDGKFYKGDLPIDKSTNDVRDFDFLGVDFRSPQGVFKRKPADVKVA